MEKKETLERLRLGLQRQRKKGTSNGSYEANGQRLSQTKRVDAHKGMHWKVRKKNGTFKKK